MGISLIIGLLFVAGVIACVALVVIDYKKRKKSDSKKRQETISFQ